MIRLVVPFPAGGPTDTASRIVGQKLAERLGQAVVVDNRPGASGSIAALQVAKSDPDGYTLMMLATPTLLAPHLYKKTGYDTLKDFTPVATVYDLPIVVVVNPAQAPDVKTLPQLIAHASAEDADELHEFGHRQLRPPKHGACSSRWAASTCSTCPTRAACPRSLTPSAARCP